MEEEEAIEPVRLTTWPLDNPMIFSLAVLAALVALVVLLHGLLQERWATVAAAILIPVAMTLVLNHVLAASRERDARRWTLRQEHLRRLQSVLRAEADKLHDAARRISSTGRVSSIFDNSNANELRAVFFPDVMSGDLVNHFGAYAAAKDRLRSDAEAQEREFDEAVSRIAPKLPLSPKAAQFGPRPIALAIIEKCTGHGPGMVLKVTGDSVSYSVPGASGSGGIPSGMSEIEAAYRAFNKFRPDPSVTKLCSSLTTRGAQMVEKATKLSAEARILTERTVLPPGDCEYIRLD